MTDTGKIDKCRKYEQYSIVFSVYSTHMDN